MRYDFTLHDGKEYDKIFIVGAGFSLEFFDTTLIDNKSIVIAANSGVLKLDKIDYFICSNWYSFRDSILNELSKDTTILACSKLSPDPCRVSEEFIKSTKVDRNLFREITYKIFVHTPIFMEYITNKLILTDIKDIKSFTNCIEQGIFPCGAGSTNPLFALSFYLSEKYNIDNIYYVGMDFIEIDKMYRYPKYLLSMSDHCGNKVLKDDYDYFKIKQSEISIFKNYGIQLFFNILLLSLLPETYYNKLISKSIFNFKQIPYNRIIEFKQFFINYLQKNKLYTYNTDGSELYPKILKDYDMFYNTLFNDINILENLKRNLKNFYKKKDESSSIKQYLSNKIIQTTDEKKDWINTCLEEKGSKDYNSTIVLFDNMINLYKEELNKYK